MNDYNYRIVRRGLRGIELEVENVFDALNRDSTIRDAIGDEGIELLLRIENQMPLLRDKLRHATPEHS